jgi:hypothetical protein
MVAHLSSVMQNNCLLCTSCYRTDAHDLQAFYDKPLTTVMVGVGHGSGYFLCWSQSCSSKGQLLVWLFDNAFDAHHEVAVAFLLHAGAVY